jgi:PBSX family phage terminase large subunit
VDIPILPKQLAFLQEQSREVLYSGAFGAGKTRALAFKVAIRGAVRGAFEGLCRKVGADLKVTTLQTLLEPEGDLPPVLPPGSYTHNKSEHLIHIHQGGTIFYFGLDDPGRRASLNLSGCGIEEATELKEDDYTMLRGRVRRNVAGLTRQIYMACNPGPPSHFLAERFGLSQDRTEPVANCAVVRTRSRDNHFLPADYLADLDTFTGLRKARYVEGLWVGSEGLVYDRWDRRLHVREREFEPARVVCAIDDGYSHPFAALRLEVDHDGRVHVAAERYAKQLSTGQKIAAVRDIGADAEAWVVDSAAAQLVRELNDEGLSARPVDKSTRSVFEGIVHLVAPRLEVAGDGEPRLTVDQSCANTIREFESYEWSDTRRDEPVKELDHAMDALRYGCMYLDTAGQFGVAAARQEVVAAGWQPDPESDLSVWEQRRRADPEWGWN